MADLVQATHTLMVQTSGKGFFDITHELKLWLKRIDADAGLLTVFICHTSASLTVQENADPNVIRDLMTALDEIAPEDKAYTHAEEGPDDMPSHIKSMVTSVSLGIPVKNRQMVLGTWQDVYVIEHREAPHQRKIALSFVGHCAAA